MKTEQEIRERINSYQNRFPEVIKKYNLVSPCIELLEEKKDLVLRELYWVLDEIEE